MSPSLKQSIIPEKLDDYSASLSIDKIVSSKKRCVWPLQL